MADLVYIDKTDMIGVQATINTIKGGSKLAIVRATNDSLSGLRTESVKLIGGKITAKAAVIRAHFKVNKMSLSSMSADIACSGKPLPLISYSVNQIKAGLSVKIFKAKDRYKIRHAFLATMKSTHKGAFWREYNLRGTGRWKVGVPIKLPSPVTGGRLRKYQLPIQELYGPRIPDIFDDTDIMQPVLANASQRFDDRLNHHTNQLLAKAA